MTQTDEERNNICMSSLSFSSSSVIHIKSSSPLCDAKAIQQIFSDRYVIENQLQQKEENDNGGISDNNDEEKKSTQDEGTTHHPTIILVECNNGDGHSRLPILILIPCRSSFSSLDTNDKKQQQQQQNLIPDATIFLKNEIEIQSCIQELKKYRSSNRNGASLLVHRQLEIPSLSSSTPTVIINFAIIKLPSGNSNILLITQSNDVLTTTTYGRRILSQLITNPMKYDEEDITVSSSNTPQEEDDDITGKRQDDDDQFVEIFINEKNETVLMKDEEKHVIPSQPAPPPPPPPPKFPSLSCKVLQMKKKKESVDNADNPAESNNNNNNNNIESVTSNSSDGGSFSSISSSPGNNNNDTSTYRTITINSRTGIPIETDFFVGRMILILRPTNQTDDEYYNEKIFTKKKRRFILQIQGKFKRKPKGGMMYAGNEITDPMKLGLVTRGLASVLLKLMSSFFSSIHFSFGDNKGIEKAHIVVPAIEFFDDIIINKPNDDVDKIPKLGEMFTEPKESKAKRKSGNIDKDNFFNTADLYSMSFHSMYYDLPTWHIRSLPALSDLNLRTFWNDSGLRMVMYEIDPSTMDGKNNNKHIHEYNKYYFVLQTEFLGLQKQEQNTKSSTSSGNNKNNNDDNSDKSRNEEEEDDDENRKGNVDEEDILPWGHERKSLRRGVSVANLAIDNAETKEEKMSSSRQYHISPSEQDERSIKTEQSGFSMDDEEDDDDDSDEKDDDDTVFFDAEDTLSKSNNDDDLGLRFDEDGDGGDDDDNCSLSTTASTFSSPLAMRSALSGDISKHIDVLCPAWVDIFTAKGKYASVYVFNNLEGDETLFRTTTQFMTYFNVARSAKSLAKRSSCSPRLSPAERTRRIIGQTYAKALLLTNPSSTVKSNIQAFKRTQNIDLGLTFLQEPSPNHPTVSNTKTSGGDKKSRTIHAYACVARATSEHRWVEEWATMTDRRISFYQPTKSKCNFSISIQNVIVVRTLDDDEKPDFPLHYFLAIETIGRTIYLMFKEETRRNQWFDLLLDVQSIARARNMYDSSSESDGLLSVDNPSEEFLHKSTDWSLKNRRILNCRKFNFTQGYYRTNNGELQKRSKLDPLSIIEGALRIVQLYTSSSSMEDLTETDLCAFLDCVSLLKEVDVVNDLKDEKEKLAFFLNVYHCMIIHAYLVVGPPRSNFQWISYFNMVSYQCSGDVFSLAELEHCVIRAAMNYPSQFVSKVVLPQSKYNFAMKIADYRINFALNCGSKSAPNVVSIYNAGSLDSQLDNACLTYIQSCVEVRGKSRSATIKLPRVCCWFADDFGSGSNSDVVCAIEKYLGEYARTTLRAAYSESKQRYPSSDLTVKYLPYSFECRNLALTDDLVTTTL